MPASPPVGHATLFHPLSGKHYILSITPSPNTPHLFLRHPSPEITIVDAQSLQPIDSLKGGHQGHVTCIATDDESTWSSGKDAAVVRWDGRGRRAGTVIKGPLKLTSRPPSKPKMKDCSVCEEASTGACVGRVRAGSPRHRRDRARLLRSAHPLLVRPFSKTHLSC